MSTDADETTHYLLLRGDMASPTKFLHHCVMLQDLFGHQFFFEEAESRMHRT